MQRKPKAPLGIILYEGPSMLDGAPIVVIATGFLNASTNAKTGRMIQTYILRADVAPHHAVKSGEDASICGKCPHRPAKGGACYVVTFQGPLAVWTAYKRGRYTPLTDATRTLGDLRDLMTGRMLRLGSYGDPAAAPYARWASLASGAAGVTGYTHQWADERFDQFRHLCMASVDNAVEGIKARAAGWRTFRVREAWETLSEREFVCPASEEAGKKTDCASCKACGGITSKAKASPVIVAHGGKARRFALTRNGHAVAA